MAKEKRMKKPRDFTIDLLRSVSILLMIVMHIAPSYLQYPMFNWIWSWGQWVVPAFILCSIVVDSSNIRTLQDYLQYLWKRGSRLLIPYYLWLASYLTLMALLGHKRITLDIILKNVMFTGGADFNWMILLFIYVALALPFLRKIVEESEKISMAVLLLSFTISAFYLGDRSYWSGAYRLWMLVPWYGITLGILLFLKWWKQNRWGHITTFFIVNLGIFTYWYLYFSHFDITTHTYYHKYPPDVFYVSFSLWSVILAYIIVHVFAKHIKKLPLVAHFLTFVSTRSYTIFFIHILVLYSLNTVFPNKPFHYIFFSFLIFVPTLLITWSFDYLPAVKKQLFAKV